MKFSKAFHVVTESDSRRVHVVFFPYAFRLKVFHPKSMKLEALVRMYFEIEGVLIARFVLA